MEGAVPALDEAKLEQFMGQAVTDMGAAMNGVLVMIGDRLGLWKGMEGAGPLSAAELGERTGVRERYVREWLAAQAASGYVEYDPDADAFTLPPEQAMAFADEDSPVYVVGGYHVVSSAYKDGEEITIPAGQMQVENGGRIMVGGQPVAEVGVFDLNPNSSFEKVGDNLYRATDGVTAIDYSVTDKGSGISDVSFFVDGIQYAVKASACTEGIPLPCPLSDTGSFVLDTTRLSEGDHTIAIVARDYSGNVMQQTEKQQTITVRRAPEQSASNPVSTTNPSWNGGGSPAVGDHLTGDNGGWSGAHWWAGKGLVDGEIGGGGADWGTALVNGKFVLGVGSTGGDVTVASSANINNGAWRHVAATRDNTTGAMRVYVDGVLSGSGTGPTGSRSWPTSLRIGGLLPGANYLNGVIDDVRLYDRVLSAAEIAETFGPAPTAPAGEGLEPGEAAPPREGAVAAAGLGGDER